MIDWWGPVLWEYYAGTEGNGFCLRQPRRSGSPTRHRSGKPLLGDHAHLRRRRQRAARRRGGTVYFERRAVPFEYHNDPAKTRDVAAPRAPGLDDVGDVGYVDDDGYLFLTDRKAFMIISGGVNIYPQEIENVLAMHPKVPTSP